MGTEMAVASAGEIGSRIAGLLSGRHVRALCSHGLFVNQILCLLRFIRTLLLEGLRINRSIAAAGPAALGRNRWNTERDQAGQRQHAAGEWSRESHEYLRVESSDHTIQRMERRHLSVKETRSLRKRPSRGTFASSASAPPVTPLCDPPLHNLRTSPDSEWMAI